MTVRVLPGFSKKFDVTCVPTAGVPIVWFFVTCDDTCDCCLIKLGKHSVI